MVVFPNCKINIGLNILAKRPDGYHDLQTVFYPLGIKDALEIIESDELTNPITYSSSGLEITGKTENNLCIKAYQLLKNDFPSLPFIKMHLHKTIPMGAGLGGGSADAAFTLQLINKKFSLQLSQQQLLLYALELGSDCPFFIYNKPCFAKGRGEILEPVVLDLSNYSFLIINPGIHINTQLAFSTLSIKENIPPLRSLITKPIADWKNEIVNDFEKTIFPLYPAIVALKNQLYAAGAIYASMSGSGSSVFGIFQKDNRPLLNFPPHYFYRWV
jgi:4-diphosphocytidyl-2-C-methyl-D-erythritol kinase